MPVAQPATRRSPHGREPPALEPLSLEPAGDDLPGQPGGAHSSLTVMVDKAGHLHGRPILVRNRSRVSTTPSAATIIVRAGSSLGGPEVSTTADQASCQPTPNARAAGYPSAPTRQRISNQARPISAWRGPMAFGATGRPTTGRSRTRVRRPPGSDRPSPASVELTTSAVVSVFIHHSTIPASAQANALAAGQHRHLRHRRGTRGGASLSVLR